MAGDTDLILWVLRAACSWIWKEGSFQRLGQHLLAEALRKRREAALQPKEGQLGKVTSAWGSKPGIHACRTSDTLIASPVLPSLPSLLQQVHTEHLLCARTGV